VLKAAILKIVAFWVPVPCKLAVGYLYFGGTPHTLRLNCERRVSGLNYEKVRFSIELRKVKFKVESFKLTS
jgi:hypothetical protein